MKFFVENQKKRVGKIPLFGKIQYFVLDEADRLLKGSFAEDMDVILKNVNPMRKKTLLYSATMDTQIKQFAAMAMKKNLKKEEKTEQNSEKPNLENKKVEELEEELKTSEDVFVFDACRYLKTADKLGQFYLFVPETLKECYLMQLMDFIANDPFASFYAKFSTLLMRDGKNNALTMFLQKSLFNSFFLNVFFFENISNFF